MQGTTFEVGVVAAKSYNVKHLVSSKDPTFNVELWAHDPDSEPRAEGWMTDFLGPFSLSFVAGKGADASLAGKPHPNFEKICTVAADLSTLIATLPVLAKDNDPNPEKQFVLLDVQLIVYLGSSSLEACVSWMEEVRSVRSCEVRRSRWTLRAGCGEEGTVERNSRAVFLRTSERAERECEARGKASSQPRPSRSTSSAIPLLRPPIRLGYTNKAT